jgi:hypothetical protein
MKQSIATSTVTTQPNDLRSRLDEIRATKAHGQIEPKEILPVIRRAMAKTGTTQKAFALAARCTESELSEALNDRDGRRFDAEWIWRQDDAFLLVFLDEVTEARGLTPESKDAIRKQRIVELIGLLLQVAS